MKQSSPTYLKHHFLIAMPHMADPNFAQTVTYLVEHNEQGAMGLVINRPSGLNLAEVLATSRCACCWASTTAPGRSASPSARR